MADRIFLSIIPLPIARRFAPLFRGLSHFLMKYFPQLPQEMKKLDIEFDADDYLSIGMMSYFLIAFVLGFGLSYLFIIQNIEPRKAYVVGGLIGLVIFGLMIFLAVKHPTSHAEAKAKEIDKTLVYGLRDISLQISSGETLFTALANVSKADYGELSNELSIVMKKINVGIPMGAVLKQRVTLIQSEYLKKTYWQLINSLRAGADLKNSLNSILQQLDAKQKMEIANYARELGLWSLIYMMFSVAIPTIGLTMLVILSAFAGGGIEEASFISFVVICFIIQAVLIVFIKSRRPVVQF